MILVEAKDDRLVFSAPALMKDLLRQVPGMRWNRTNNDWRAPLSWSTALAARNILGNNMELSPTALGWGAGELAWRQHSIVLKKAPWPSHQYGYQECGIEWLTLVGRGVLGDEPGLGKTRQAIMAATFPCLVICPNLMRDTWKREFEKWRPGINACVLDGSSVKKSKQLGELHDLWIVNVESIRTLSRLSAYGSLALNEKERIPGPLNRSWATVIADEAHAFKDPKAKQTRAYWAIMSTAERRYALTGTLVPESPENIWSVMHGLCPEEYPSRVQFVDRYTITISAFWGGLEVLGLKPETKEEFMAFFSPRFLRRTKAEALPQLPEKTYSTRYLPMEPKQRKAYDDLERKFLAAVDGGTLVATGPLPQRTRLLQAASATPNLDDDGNVGLGVPSNKVNALLEIIEESPNEPLAVFSPSRKLIELAAVYLDKARITYACITGNQTPIERQKAINDFQSGAVQIILGTTKAGGVGITLARAQRLVFLSRPEPAVESIQTEDRVHRIGQTGAVEIIDLISIDTVEHDVHEHLGDKTDKAQEIYADPIYLRRLILARHQTTVSSER